ncbi:TRAP transporter small permease [Fulvimarina sp. 2208YS6-2-32]|uniref:TRAP transporter small permease protein n=1 Tax=Fulvimarina uroteuthidis TaxID=3098149 RepID=A0ABU5I0D3_9HYPH|nr:TRAP transporter small permease [Fulvimarina sp. 2208YS6-2-32]MDY8108839.1 TRAP transporter small permease [Fulvimarina sp. 2208YS6-2-32]
MSDPTRTTDAIDLAATSEGVARTAPEAGAMGRVVDRFGYLFAAGIVVAAAILLLEVFLRYFFNAPTIWAHETTVFLSGIAFVFGGLYCTAKNSHIRVVLLYDLLSPPVRRVADIVISIVSAIASGFFAYAAWHMVTRAVVTPAGTIRLETTGSAWSPPTPALVKIFVFVVMVLLVIQFLILAVNYARGTDRSAK